MEHLSENTINKARQVDLLSYLQLRDPGNLVKAGHDTYCTREHDSLKINNGKWFWFSRGVGGTNALDYLMTVQGYRFADAVNEVLEGGAIPYVPSTAPAAERKLVLPEKNRNTIKVEKYLLSRGIHPQVIRYCIDKGLLFESAKYHNAVFVGYSDSGEPKYAAVRSTFASYKGEAPGSDKTYSFRIADNPKATDLHIFEAAIDLLSLASMKAAAGENWLREAYVSLGGISQSSARNGLPKGLHRFLVASPNIESIHLHLDNDEPGRNASKALMRLLGSDYMVFDEPPPIGKDMNEYLIIKQLEYEREDFER